MALLHDEDSGVRSAAASAFGKLDNSMQNHLGYPQHIPHRGDRQGRRHGVHLQIQHAEVEELVRVQRWAS